MAGVSASGLCAWSLGSGVASGAEVGVAFAGARVLGLLGVADVARLGGIRIARPTTIRYDIGDGDAEQQTTIDFPLYDSIYYRRL